ncbi:distal tail protein Dit [Bacillus pacificus]
MYHQRKTERGEFYNVQFSGRVHNRGVSNSSLSLIVLDKEVPLMPPISNQDEDAPGMDGAHDFGVKYDPKIIPVKVQVLGAESKADYNNKLRNLATKLNPRIGAKPLIFADEPDKQYYARLSETFDPQGWD